MLLSYIVFNVLNVIIQTVKSIVTIKCNKWVASVVNAVAYGLYTYIVILTASDLDLWFKIIVTAAAHTFLVRSCRQTFLEVYYFFCCVFIFL